MRYRSGFQAWFRLPLGDSNCRPATWGFATVKSNEVKLGYVLVPRSAWFGERKKIRNGKCEMFAGEVRKRFFSETRNLVLVWGSVVDEAVGLYTLWMDALRLIRTATGFIECCYSFRSLHVVTVGLWRTISVCVVCSNVFPEALIPILLGYVPIRSVRVFSSLSHILSLYERGKEITIRRLFWTLLWAVEIKIRSASFLRSVRFCRMYLET